MEESAVDRLVLRSDRLLALVLFLLSALLVTACGAGDGEAPTPVTPAPQPAPPPPPAPEPTPSRVPANLRVSASGEDFIEWSWDVVEGVSGYRVQFSLDEDFTEDDEIIARAAAQNAYRRRLSGEHPSPLRRRLRRLSQVWTGRRWLRCSRRRTVPCGTPRRTG